MGDEIQTDLQLRHTALGDLQTEKSGQGQFVLPLLFTYAISQAKSTFIFNTESYRRYTMPGRQSHVEVCIAFV